MGRDLRKVDLSRSNPAWANLSDADLTDACFSGVIMHRANLTDVKTEGTNFGESNLSDVYLGKSNRCRKSNLTSLGFTGEEYKEIILQGEDLTDVKCK